MSTTMSPETLVRSRPSSGLAEVLDIILDRGLVIDAFVRVSLVGIELLTIDARIVVASVDTYLRFAEAVDRLNIRAKSEAMGIDDLLGGGRGGGMSGAVASGLDSAGDKLMGKEDEEEEQPAEAEQD